MTIGPVVLLGLLSIFFMLTTVRSSMMEEIEEGLKGTAAATLAAYDQNTGDYMESSNGDIWKGSYNISHSESLVDRIKDNTGMDVTFFYGDRRIMTSALDSNGDRILNSPAGERIVEKVLQNGEEYFSNSVSLDGVMNYGYFMPVYQNGSDDEIIGMVFVGTDKESKDAVVNGIIFGIGAAVCVAMILCIGVGLAPAFKMRFWNIGAEGQILIGGIVTAGFMRAFGGDISTPLLLVIMAVVSLLAGAAWGMVPATFKAVWNTNETLFTLMMNYVAIQLTSYFVALWENPVGSNTVGVINQRTKDGWFPELFGQEYGLNVVLVLLLTVGMFLYLKYSKQGYEISVVGDSENTARYAGINVKKVTIRTMAISGAICGLAGFIAVAGASHTISTSTAGGRGFTAIIVAWLAQFNTFVMILISFLLVFLQKGAIQIASQFNLNDYASNIITGIILFFILGSEFFINYRIILRGGKEGAK